MRAAVLRRPGAAPVLAEHPDPAAGEVLVRVTAAPVVPLDLLCASGTSYFGRPAVPYVPGVQGVGVVEGGAGPAPGTRVWFATRAGMAPGDGSLAERCAMPGQDVVPLADGVGDEVAAAVGLSGVAAWMALSWRGALQPGERVLVLGGGGAVGQAAAGAARVLGAARVVSLCRSEAAAARARRAGADAVVRLDGDEAALAAALRDALHGPADVVVDPVFGPAAAAACRALAPGGRLVNLGGASGDTAVLSSAVLRSAGAGVLGYTNNALSPAQRARALTDVLAAAARGDVVVEHEVAALDAVGAAWASTAAGGTRTVLRP
ncbi:quinone oxidoreductase family protein [Vallicoccus soli]|uniref:Zinc-binding alcohol dehydrogenase family protein n=1 Tax=Vallicoccus soli TaxID=2339232 RepID=A0A3A3YT36_9ACTN|nr:zinc-binding alcohol dehydrogenase family protein [Vallicoccus soli]RJK93838.1 zinc-binding alcohol dehydrogenase family protein [Vallicoccus soli]